MRISIVVNTSALGPRAHEITGSHTPSPHAFRAYALDQFILPSYEEHADEVIVVGEWREGEGYKYVHCPSRAFSCVDALAQRQAGFEASTGDLIVHVHDDHFLAPESFSALRWWEADVFVPTRYRREFGRVTIEPNGCEGVEWYVPGHCAIYKRKVIERVPWTSVPPVFTWDVEHTKLMTAEGFKLLWHQPGLEVFDVEIAR